VPGLRAASDADWWGLTALIGACWSEYPGCVVDVAGEYPELLAPASHYRDIGGALWVVPEGKWIAACVGLAPVATATTTATTTATATPTATATVELVKLYVARHRRGQGLGQALVAVAEGEARTRGASTVQLWSDSRFHDAHRLYQRLGYQRTAAIRELHDRSATIEHHFAKELGGA
jgi:putative acetyltransferase